MKLKKRRLWLLLKLCCRHDQSIVNKCRSGSEVAPGRQSKTIHGKRVKHLIDFQAHKNVMNHSTAAPS